MMTGPEHHREAVRLLSMVVHPESGNVYDHGQDFGGCSDMDNRYIAVAHVHAVLANAAAQEKMAEVFNSFGIDTYGALHVSIDS